MRPSRGVWGFLVVFLIGLAAVFLFLQPVRPIPFNPAQWGTSDKYHRFAMSADLANRITVERWTTAQVMQATGARKATGIGMGWRHPLSGGYYLAVRYDESGRATNASVHPE